MKSSKTGITFLKDYKFSLFFKDEYLTVCKSGERFLNHQLLSIFGLKLSARSVSFEECIDDDGELFNF